MTWIGFPVALAVGLLIVPAGVRGLLDAGLSRDNYRGRAAAFPLGAVIATSASSRWRRSPSSTTAPTSTSSTPACDAGSPT